MISKVKGSLFELGQVVFTPGTIDMAASGLNLIPYLVRHASGDWGDLEQSDKNENNFSVKNGFRILSSYKTPLGKLWIITEADRSVTTLLLPEEY